MDSEEITEIHAAAMIDEEDEKERRVKSKIAAQVDSMANKGKGF